MVLLGVNIDHVATLRQARGGLEPDTVRAAIIAQSSGADGITVHLREDRRHIQDKDIYSIKSAISIPLNLEMACKDEIVRIALDLKPRMCTLVPEKRQELTTEGGLDAGALHEVLSPTVKALSGSGIEVSLFIEPEKSQIDAAVAIGAGFIEIHTGRYANETGERLCAELERIKEAVSYAQGLGLKVNAGHGLNYENTSSISAIKGINELNIGHSIISRAVFSGLAAAVADMKKIVSGVGG